MKRYVHIYNLDFNAQVLLGLGKKMHHIDPVYTFSRDSLAVAFAV